MVKKTFILSDETINQYGLIVQTNGIDLERFKQNPVMLKDHSTGLDDVIGKWNNLRIKGTALLADTCFDEVDPKVKEIARKVDRGFIKGVSVWVDFKAEDVKLNKHGVLVITKSELMEASIVTVPNNKSCVTLRNEGEEIKDGNLAVKLSAIRQNITPEKQGGLPFIFASLGLKFIATSTEAHAVEAIKVLLADHAYHKTRLLNLQTKLNAKQDIEINNLMEWGFVTKKINVKNKDHFVKLAKLDFDTTRAVIESLRPVASFFL